MEALTLRGLQETDTIKRGPQDKDTKKPENRNSETKDGNSKFRSRWNLSKDHDGGSDPERTSKTDMIKPGDGKSENVKS